MENSDCFKDPQISLQGPHLSVQPTPSDSYYKQLWTTLERSGQMGSGGCEQTHPTPLHSISPNQPYTRLNAILGSHY